MSIVKGIVISVGDYTGAWSKPWRERGHYTVRVDPKLTDADQRGVMDIPVGKTVREYINDLRWGVPELRGSVVGVLLAPPCTHFSSSGAQFWPAKDTDGRTAQAVEVVRDCLELVRFIKPYWWFFENPVGRLAKLVPELGKPRLYVQPHDYTHHAPNPQSERYTKKTGLWGEGWDVAHMRSLSNNGHPAFAPIKSCKQGSWLQMLGGSSERVKALRSRTPQGLSLATYMASLGDADD